MPHADRPHSVLLIDEDRRLGRLVRLALNSATCQVLVSDGHVEGLRLAARQKPDLILMETQFKGADGIHLGGKLLEAPETQNCALAFLTADPSLSRRFRAIQMGACDYLTKPIEGQTLSDRVAAIFTRIDECPRQPVIGPAADLLIATLEQLEKDGESATLSLQRGSLAARIVVVDGLFDTAECGSLRDEDALNRIASFGDWVLSSRQRRITVETKPALPSVRRVAAISPSDSAPADAFREDELTTVDPRQRVPDDETGTAPGEVVGGSPELEKAGTKGGAPAASESEAAFQEDVPTAMSFHADVNTEPGFTPPPASRAGASTGAAHGDLRTWLSRQSAPLLLVGPASDFRDKLEGALEQMGFHVNVASTGLEAYTGAQRTRPVAILADERGPDLDGRELLAAIRSDFLVRETPFLIASSEVLASQLSSAGPEALMPVLHGLEAALSPRMLLDERLTVGEQEVKGWVEPVGTAYLLRALGKAESTGRIDLTAKAPGDQSEKRRAEATFREGEICSASVKVGQQHTEGPVALLNLLGWEWSEYVFCALPTIEAQPLGDLQQLIETALQRNNVSLARLYQQGLDVEDLSVDRAALEQYLQKLPAGSQELGRRLVEGEQAASLVEKGSGTPGLLKSMLHEMFRKGILQPVTMGLVQPEWERHEAAIKLRPPRGGRRRWLVIALAGLITVGCAAGGYFFYTKMRAERGSVETPTSAPASDSGLR